jgi:hypothetical protein
MEAVLRDYAIEHGEQIKITPEEVEVCELRQVRGGYSLPRAWAMENLPHVAYADETVYPSLPAGIVLPRGKINPRDDQQAKFFADLLDAALRPGPQNILANATTGTGKTVAAIYLGWKLRTPTIIVVDSNKIANGWLKNFRQFFGDAWTERNVGRAQQDVCDYEGKWFVIALAQSLARRNYGTDFYRYFGLHVTDEVQVFGGPNFAPVLYNFPARVRAAFTAENRGGAFGKRIKAHVGDTRVESLQSVLEPMAWVISNRLQQPFYCYSDGALLTNLSKIPERNDKLAKLIYRRGYQRGRQVLVLSNRTDQLKELYDRCVALGVPAKDMGLHVGGYTTNNFVVYYNYLDSNKRTRVAVVGSRSEAQAVIREMKKGRYHTFDLPAAFLKKLEKGVEVEYSFDPEVYNPTQTELDDITHSCQIVFATYEIFSKGVDVPRLDMGVEALPSGNVKQPLGRVLRLFPGKPNPEWYSIHDTIDENTEDQRTALLREWFNGKTALRVTALRKAKAKTAFQ